MSVPEIPISRPWYIAHRLHSKIENAGRETLSRLIQPKYTIVGAYNTQNLGDLAMGMTLREIARSLGIPAHLAFLGSHGNISASSAAVMGGGELGNPTSFSCFKKHVHGQSARAAVIGVNASVDIEEAPAELLEFLAALPFISQRTRKATMDLARLLGREVVYQPDITFAIPLLFPEAISSHGRSEKIGISFSPMYMTVRDQSRLVPSKELEPLFARYNPAFHRYLGVAGIRYTEVVQKLVDVLSARGQKLVHIAFSPVDDLFSRSVLGAKSGVEFVRFWPDPLRALREISECASLYATRFHAHIFGLLARVPTVSIAYSQKCETLWEDLGLDPGNQVNRMDIASEPEKTLERLTSLSGVEIGMEKYRLLTREALEISTRGLTSVGNWSHGLQRG